MKRRIYETNMLVVPLIATPAALIGWLMASRSLRRKSDTHGMKIFRDSKGLHVRHTARVGDYLSWYLPSNLGIPEVWIHFENSSVCSMVLPDGGVLYNDFPLTSGDTITCSILRSTHDEGFDIMENDPALFPSDPVPFSQHCNGCYYTPPPGT